MENENENVNELWETTDYYFTSFVSALGKKIQSVRRLNKRKLIFVFSAVDVNDELVKRFYNGEETIDPLKYINGMRTVKGLIKLYENGGKNENINERRNIKS